MDKQYQHDCDGCTYLGTVSAPDKLWPPGSTGTIQTVYDLYYCNLNRERPEMTDLIARYGDEPQDNASVWLKYVTLLANPGLLIAASLLLWELGYSGAAGGGFVYKSHTGDGPDILTGWSNKDTRWP